MLRLPLIFVLSFWIANGASAQEFPFDLELPATGAETYNAAVPTPDETIGHRIGTRHTIPSQVVDFFQAIAASSDRVVLRDHGRTHEGRRLIHAIITAPQNHQNIESIRASNLRLSDSPGEVTDEDITDGKLIIYLGYSVHGNEASGTEAAILTLYHLAAGEGPEIEDLLNHAVVIVDPMLNPDGRDRFADWVNRNRGLVHTTDSQDREHNEPWPGGRTNHYWFDLNRDWLPAQHPESVGRLEVFHHWRPQVHTDVHEMGGDATYFFQPGIPSRTHHLTPPANQELTAEIAEYHARILESVGSLYYSEESFDDFYYGKASAYPDANGAVGILFEQASSRALEADTDRGDLHYAFTVRNQFLTSLSTLKASLEMREKLLRYQRDYYDGAPEFASDIGVSAYLVDISDAATRGKLFSDFLNQHRIETRRLTTEVTLGRRTFTPDETILISAEQAQARLLRSLMETPTSFSDSIFYDVSTWNMPYAYNLPFAEFSGRLSSIEGDPIEDDFYDRGAVYGRSDYAYVMPWKGYFVSRAAYQLADAGFRVRILKEPFSVDGPDGTMPMPRGSVLIPVEGAELDAQEPADILAEIAAEYNVAIYATGSGLTATGPDLGTGTSVSIRVPNIAVITGPGTSAYNAGEVWHLLAHRMQIPVSLIDSDRLERVELERYDVIIHAGGSSGSTVDSEPVKEWISDGGTLITTSSGTNWAVNNELLDFTEHTLDVDSLVAEYNYADLSRARGAKRLAGAVIIADLDATHPLAYGIGDTLPLFRTSSTLISPPEEPGTAVGKYSDNPVASGYVPDEVLPDIPGKMAIATQRHGRGKIIAFADNLTFRGYWYGSNMALMNAILLNRAF